MSPIVVRPLPMGSETSYEIVAGERRWRSSINAFGQTEENLVPVMIRVLSDAEAMDAALIPGGQSKFRHPWPPQIPPRQRSQIMTFPD